MGKRKNPFLGRWRIFESDLLDKKGLDFYEPAYIEFRKKNSGLFVFGSAHGNIDFRFLERNGLPLLEFSWEGQEEGDLVSGRGWAELKDKEIFGQIFTHGADEASFKARKA